jgi:micrococcal nuclease
LEKDVSETDQYDRLLRYVYADGIFVNAELVRLGYAQVSTYPPDVKYQEYFEQLQQEAQTARIGQWALTITTVPPNTAASSDIVYITNTGEKYHRDGCRYLSISRIPISRADAIAQGYTPCSVCKP